ncbi:hypothetical protein BGZ83_003344, partial [Gryganskiella cystojenkinii]
NIIRDLVLAKNIIRHFTKWITTQKVAKDILNTLSWRQTLISSPQKKSVKKARPKRGTLPPKRDRVPTGAVENTSSFGTEPDINLAFDANLVNLKRDKSAGSYIRQAA